VELAEPLHPREEPSLAIVEARLDVEREDVAPGRRPDPESDRDRIVRLVADRERDQLHPELLGPRRRPAVEANGGLAGRKPLDLDVAPADAADPEAEDLRHGLLRRPAPGEGLRPHPDIALLGRGQDPLRESLAEALDRGPDPVDLDDVDPELADRTGNLSRQLHLALRGIIGRMASRSSAVDLGGRRIRRTGRLAAHGQPPTPP